MTFIPERLEEITPEWLSEALRGRRHLVDGKVGKIGFEILGEGEGFLGVIARLRLTFEGAADGAPTSLVAKIPTLDAENRSMGELLGAYWREIHFYEELAPGFPVPVPRSYYADLTPDPVRERQNEVVRTLDRFPGWLTSALMVASRWIVKRSSHRYVLLIEDLVPAARVGDQLAGAEPDVCARVLETAARMHAAYWETRELDGRFWLARQDVGARTRHGLYRRARKAFRARYGALLRGRGADAVDWLDRNGVALQTALCRDAPRTLIHCDLRFDNVFLNERDVIFADWQLVGAGPAAYDVAYFLSGALRSEHGPGSEESLLRAYHDALSRHGVEAYPFERLQRDYWRALLSVFSVIASTDAVNLGDGRGADMMDAWIERALTRLERIPLDRMI